MKFKDEIKAGNGIIKKDNAEYRYPADMKDVLIRRLNAKKDYKPVKSYESIMIQKTIIELRNILKSVSYELLKQDLEYLIIKEKELNALMNSPVSNSQNWQAYVDDLECVRNRYSRMVNQIATNCGISPDNAKIYFAGRTLDILITFKNLI